MLLTLSRLTTEWAATNIWGIHLRNAIFAGMLKSPQLLVLPQSWALSIAAVCGKKCTECQTWLGQSAKLTGRKAADAHWAVLDIVR